MLNKNCTNKLIISFLFVLIQINLAESKNSVITLMTHDSFAVSQKTIRSFEKENNATLKIIKSGDAGAALTQTILSKNNPMADVFFGVDNTYMSRAIKADIFTPYSSPYLKNIPLKLQKDATHRLLPVDYGDVCLNIDHNWFKKNNLKPPHDLKDLMMPDYKGLTVVMNPATSSPGLAFLLTSIGAFGEQQYQYFWRQLRKNKVYVSNGWTDAYYGKFTRAKGGSCPIIVSYATSPAAEVYYSETKLKASPTRAILEPKTAFRQIEFAGILKGTKQLDLAKKLIDFMLSPQFQKDIPLHMWVYPAADNISLPDVFIKFAKQAESPVSINHKIIDQNREKWINGWTQTVLR